MVLYIVVIGIGLVFLNIKVNIIPLGFEKFSKEKILNLKPKGIILPGGNDLYLIKKNNLNLERDILREN